MTENRFKVLPKDEEEAIQLHEYIVAQSKVVTALSKQATNFVQENEFDAAQQIYMSMAGAQAEMNRAYKEMAELRKGYVDAMIQIEKLHCLIKEKHEEPMSNKPFKTFRGVKL